MTEYPGTLLEKFVSAVSIYGGGLSDCISMASPVLLKISSSNATLELTACRLQNPLLRLIG